MESRMEQSSRRRSLLVESRGWRRAIPVLSDGGELWSSCPLVMCRPVRWTVMSSSCPLDRDVVVLSAGP